MPKKIFEPSGKYKAVIVLEHLLQGRPLKIRNDTYRFDDDLELCIEAIEYVSVRYPDKIRVYQTYGPVLMKTDMSLREFLYWCNDMNSESIVEQVSKYVIEDFLKGTDK